MIVKTTIIGIACCALVAPLAFGKDSQTVTFEKGVTVAGAAPVTTVERGEAASYQPPKTLVVRNEGSGLYVLDGKGHVFDSKGNRLQSQVRPGAHVQVYFANNRGVRTVDHVVVD
jgi:uncharacterized protein YfaS (alpha-2-macroglobulin family)